MIRIGVISPHDMALDRELWEYAPASVLLHLTRLPERSHVVDLAMVSELSDTDDLVVAARSIAAVAPVAYAYACTSGSFVGGVAGERRISRVISEAVGVPAVTTSGALLEELAVRRITSLSVVTPYRAELSDLLAAFLVEAGHRVVDSRGLGLDRDIWNVPYATTADLIRAADNDLAEAIFVSCTNLPTRAIVDDLSSELGKPVLTANQVTIDGAVRAAAGPLPVAAGL